MPNDQIIDRPPSYRDFANAIERERHRLEEGNRDVVWSGLAAIERAVLEGDVSRYVALRDGQFDIRTNRFILPQAPAPRRVPEPSTRQVPAPPPVDAEYQALARELQVGTVALDLQRFKTWLATSGRCVYERGEVQVFLHVKYGVPPESGITQLVAWGWRPLREADRHRHATLSSANGAVQWGAPTYAKPIPYPVLLTIKAVTEEAPSARFYVSDEMQAEAIPDPFLLVVVGTEEFVIERWDEPAFRPRR